MGRCGRKRTGHVCHLVAEGCHDADQVARAGQVSEHVKRTLRNAMKASAAISSSDRDRLRESSSGLSHHHHGGTKTISVSNCSGLLLRTADVDVLPPTIPSVDGMQVLFCDLSNND